MTLSAKVIAEDHRLEGAATTALEDLARLRWHWTLDESNPDRVGIREYARAIERDERTVRANASGYAEWSSTAADIRRSLSDRIELARMGAERAAATEAVAEAMGGKIASVAANHRDKIRETLEAARDAAERMGTSVAEEIPRMAQAQERQRKSAAKQREQDKAAHSLRYIQIEAHLAAAKGRLAKALDIAHDVELDGEEVELIVDMLRQVNATLRLLDARFVGDSGTDWDAEKEHLLGGAR